MIFALHGFLGRPNDWNSLFNGLSYAKQMFLEDLFQAPPLPFDQWANNFNNKAASFKDRPRILMGYSMGGRLALHALVDQPELWDAAIIISAHPGLDTEKAKLQRLEKDESWAKRFEEEDWSLLIKEWNNQSTFSGDDKSFVREELYYSRDILAGVLRQWSVAYQDNLQEKIEQLPMPILWIAGEQDLIFAEIAHKQKLKHPFSKIWVAKNATHRVPWQQQQQFLSTVNQFLTQVECTHDQYSSF